MNNYIIIFKDLFSSVRLMWFQTKAITGRVIFMVLILIFLVPYGRNKAQQNLELKWKLYVVMAKHHRMIHNTYIKDAMMWTKYWPFLNFSPIFHPSPYPPHVTHNKIAIWANLLLSISHVAVACRKCVNSIRKLIHS